MMNRCCDNNSTFVKKFAVYTMSIIMVASISWRIWCIISLALATTKCEKGLYTNTSIKDFKDGSLEALFQWMKKYSISLVIFYAPWSAQSIKQVPVFISVHSKISSPVISVIAINCWIGTCKQKFPTHFFPRIFLYHTSHPPIEYIHDVDTDLITHFVYLSISPWTHIGNEKQLDYFVKNYDNYLISYMNSSHIRNGKIYDIFYSSSLMLINRVNKPHIGIITNSRIASLLQLSKHGQIKCHPKHICNMYYSKSNYTIDKVSDWMMNQSKPVVNILKPSLDRNLYIKQLKQGPAIILSNFIDENTIIKLYQDVALHYEEGCEKSQDTIRDYYKGNICTLFASGDRLCSTCQYCLSESGCADRTLFHFRDKNNLTSHGSVCSSSFPDFPYFQSVYSDCCLNADLENLGKWNERTCLLEGEVNTSEIIRNHGKIFTLESISLSLEFLQKHMLKETEVKFSGNNQQPQDKFTSLKILDDGTLINEEYAKCAESSLQCIDEGLAVDKILEEIKGLACHTNLTLNFFILNHKKFQYLLENIGISEPAQLIIVDLRKEVHYILGEKISHKSIATFIWQYTKGYLQPSYPSPTPADRIERDSSLQIIELTSSMFKEINELAKDDNFVMFYAPWCGICKSISLIFLKLSHIYSDVIFSRINSDIHVLPWQFRPSVYPSFILFPAGKGAYSVFYPHDQLINLQNLSHFLNTHLGR